jgi:cytochrome c-type biogenesis protein CcmH/NrfG
MPDAGNHLRKAVKLYPAFSDAWVLLGQVLNAQHKAEEALNACSSP